MSLMSALVEYSDSQPRDTNGEWSSGEYHGRAYGAKKAGPGHTQFGTRNLKPTAEDVTTYTHSSGERVQVVHEVNGNTVDVHHYSKSGRRDSSRSMTGGTKEQATALLKSKGINHTFKQ